MSTPTESSAPSTAAVAIATAMVAGLGGYFIGQASSLGLFGNSKASSASSTDEQDEDTSDGEDELEQQESDLQDFGNSNEECKLVLVVRTDLGMTKGKDSPIQHAVDSTISRYMGTAIPRCDISVPSF
jgi:hypothetical protein